MPDLLIELLSEEIPARMQRKAAGDLRKLVTNALVEAGLTYEGAREYWTPRRLTIDIRGLTARSADIREEKKGPRVGSPQPAIDGFLRSAGLSAIDEAQTVSDPKKGEFYIAVVQKPGRETKQIIAEMMPGIIREFPWPKSMRWGAASAQPGSLRWVRPLKSILCTFGPETEEPEVVAFEVDGITAGDVTVGHRFLAPDEIRVKRFDDYVHKLEAAKVVLDAERRKEIILSDARNLAFARGFELVEDDGLLEETGNLVEWPVVIMGEFEEAFLALPDEVTRLTIRENQKCFVLRKAGGEAAGVSEKFGAEEAPDADAPRPRSGGEAGRVSENKLTNRFILVSNIIPGDGGAEIARGNAKVVRARLSDAKFFWESDLQIAKSHDGFDKWIGNLDTVTFHAKLGSQGERVKRMAALARELAPVVGADRELAARAAFLAKADLQSAMVFEFPELQGRMGRLYAQAAGEEPQVARAIEEHYSPLGPSDDVPSAPVSVAVALADKLDTLAGFWAIDEKPTGSKDPYALRRAALGIIRLLLENKVRMSLAGIARNYVGERLLDRAYGDEKFRNKLIENHLSIEQRESENFEHEWENDLSRVAIDEDARIIAADLLSFFHERLKVFLRDTGARHDLIDAVVTATSDDLLLIVTKVRALQALVESPEGANLLAGYKRAANILAAEEKKGTAIARSVDPALFGSDAEKSLYSALGSAEEAASKAVAVENFEAAMAALGSLRAPIDAFFDTVMVNVDDAQVRANRLAMLARIRFAIHTVADFSKIAG